METSIPTITPPMRFSLYESIQGMNYYKKNVSFIKSFNKFIFVLQFPAFDDIYCKYCLHYGPDWLITSVSTL